MTLSCGDDIIEKNEKDDCKVKKDRSLSAGADGFGPVSRFFGITAAVLAAAWLFCLFCALLVIPVIQQGGSTEHPTPLYELLKALDAPERIVGRWVLPFILPLAWLVGFALKGSTTPAGQKAYRDCGIISLLTAAAMCVLNLLLNGIRALGGYILFKLFVGLPVDVLVLGCGLCILAVGKALDSDRLQKTGRIYAWGSLFCLLFGFVFSWLTIKSIVPPAELAEVNIPFVVIEWVLCVPVCITAMFDALRAVKLSRKEAQ